MAVKRACQGLSQSRRKVPIKVSSAMRGERSSRETKRAPSKFIAQITTGNKKMNKKMRRGSSYQPPFGSSVTPEPGALPLFAVPEEVGGRAVPSPKSWQDCASLRARPIMTLWEAAADKAFFPIAWGRSDSRAACAQAGRKGDRERGRR